MEWHVEPLTMQADDLYSRREMREALHPRFSMMSPSRSRSYNGLSNGQIPEINLTDFDDELVGSNLYDKISVQRSYIEGMEGRASSSEYGMDERKAESSTQSPDLISQCFDLVSEIGSSVLGIMFRPLVYVH